MAKSLKALQDATRAQWVNTIFNLLVEAGEDVQKVGSNALGFYSIDEEGNETAVKVLVQIPKGSREGDEFDPVGEAEDFQMRQAEKEKKAAAAAIAKAKKIEADKKRREEAAQRKAEKAKPVIGEV